MFGIKSWWGHWGLFSHEGSCGWAVYQGQKVDIQAAWLRHGVVLTGSRLQDHWRLIIGESMGGGAGFVGPDLLVLESG